MADIDTPSATPTPQSGGEVPRAGAPISDLAAFGLGALAALCWLAALLLDFQTTGLPGWAHEAAHAALVLVVPAVIVLIGLRHRLGELQTVIALLVMVVAALPALLPVTIGNNPLSLPVRVPTLALGVALGVVVPRRLMPDGAIEPGLSAATVGGAGAAMLMGLASFALFEVGRATATCTGGARLACGGLEVMVATAFCGITVLTILFAVGAAALGSVVGRALARLGQ